MTSRKIFLINWEMTTPLVWVPERMGRERIISSFFQGIFLQSKMKQQPEEVGSRKFFCCCLLFSFKLGDIVSMSYALDFRLKEII